MDVVIDLLADEDDVVRETATATICRLVNRLFYPEDWPNQDTLTALVERKVPL